MSDDRMTQPGQPEAPTKAANPVNQANKADAVHADSTQTDSKSGAETPVRPLSEDAGLEVDALAAMVSPRRPSNG